jgi:beta-glucosidase
MDAFPNDFLWGTSTSAHQVEGGNRNDWSDHERSYTPSGAACDFVRLFEDDLDRARSLGTNAFRFSLEWSRVEPRPDEDDRDGWAYYERLATACRARGLRPVLTLSHFTLPGWIAARGGWLAPETLDRFERHVARVAERLLDRVDVFVTVNEPNVLSGAGYLSGVFPPGRRFRPDLAGRCQAALVRAHARAYRALKGEAERRGLPVLVGASPHVVSWRASRWDPLGLVRSAGERFNWAFLDAIETGRLRFDAVDEVAPEVRGTLDFVGLNYFLGAPAHLAGALRFAGLLAKERGPATSDMGWPIDAPGFTDVVVEAARRYGKPLIVTENGIADTLDAKRPEFLVAHVEALARAARLGADVRGYLHWSLIDNFEWHEGYGPRFGLFAVDYATQRRTERESADVYRRLITRHAPVAV